MDKKKYYRYDGEAMRNLIDSKVVSHDIFIVLLEGISYENSQLHLLVEYCKERKRYQGVVIILNENKYHKVRFSEHPDDCIRLKSRLTELTGVKHFSGIRSKLDKEKSVPPIQLVGTERTFEASARLLWRLINPDIHVEKINRDP